MQLKNRWVDNHCHKAWKKLRKTAVFSRFTRVFKDFQVYGLSISSSVILKNSTQILTVSKEPPCTIKRGAWLPFVVFIQTYVWGSVKPNLRIATNPSNTEAREIQLQKYMQDTHVIYRHFQILTQILLWITFELSVRLSTLSFFSLKPYL